MKSDFPGVHPDDAVELLDCSGGLPRFFTGPHPKAVRSLFDAEAEAFIREEMGMQILPWQKAVLSRAFQVDESDRLCFRVVTVSVGRQSGKSYLIRMLTNLRQRLFTEEPQQMLHLARVREAGRAVLTNPMLTRWAQARDIEIRLSNGQESWRWPDGSAWELSALSGAYGRTANLVLMDEVWDIQRRQYYEGVQPTTAARPRAQTWFFSAAHREATDLVPLMMDRAIEGRDGYALFDWGARPEDDLSDPAVWKRMGPHWDEYRAQTVEDAAGEDAFTEQWANRWPPVQSAGKELAVPNWSKLPVSDPEPDEGGVIALDETRDGSRFALVRMVEDSLWFHEFHDLASAVEVANTADDVIVGMTLAEAVVAAGLRNRPVKFGVRELAAFTPLLRHRVKAGDLSHDHNPEVAEQAATAVVVETEQGWTISAKRSANDIHHLKLACWVTGYQRAQSKITPMIYRYQ